MNDQTVLDNRAHLALTADGLLRASQYSRDGGYSIAFSLIHGWQRGYVETTGYTVPSVLDLGDFFDRPDLREDALRQAHWLLQHQREDGSFPDITRTQSAAFDTGQVLLGLTRVFRETGDKRYGDAAMRAADWLCSLSQPDGSWRGSIDALEVSPTYLTRSAAALLKHGLLIGEDRHVQHALRFCDWALTQQMEGGLFRHSQLPPDEGYLLHTVVYVLEGLLEAYEGTREGRYLDAVRRGAEPLLEVSLHRDVTLFSHYDEHLKPLTDYKCITGLAQWAGICLRLYEITGEERYRSSASNAIYYVKSKQLRVDGMLRGALPGSIPIWGDYLKLSYPSWNLKFFADALLLWERLGNRQRSHQEIYVATSHDISASDVGWSQVKSSLADSDLRLLARIEGTIARHVPAPEAASVVDLGCGEGRYLEWFGARKLYGECLGIDPLPPENALGRVVEGTAHNIPLPDDSVDCIYAAIALQHIGNLHGALAEVRRVLRRGGVFIVFDRDPISLRGLLKPWHEFKGRWLYRWDSPFRERWRTIGEWCAALRQGGFEVVERVGFAEPSGSGFRRRLPINRFVYVAAKKGDA